MPRVLVIKEEESVRKQIGERLGEGGYEIFFAGTANEGLTSFHSVHPEIVILDLKLPNMGGIGFLKQLNPEISNPYSVIVLSGKETETEAQKCYQLGIHTLLRKPVDLLELEFAVKRSLDIVNYAMIIQDLNMTLEQKVKDRTKELQKLSQAIEQNPSPVIIINMENAIEYINPRFIEETGYSTKEVTGKNPWFLGHGKISALAYRHMRDAMKEGKEWRGELQVKKKDNSLYWVLASISPLRDDSGVITHYLAVTKSIADIKQAKDDLEKANLQLELSFSELERITRVFKLFVPQQFLNRIQIHGPDGVTTGSSVEERLTIFFADIRNFTQMTEKNSASETFNFLNNYLDIMEPCITEYAGFIDKFIGDGIMALFDQAGSANQAVQAAITMQRALSEFNEKREMDCLERISIGIGVNTGQVLVGTLGSDHRLNSTVIGDHVNLAARLETLTKKYHARILISQYTYAEIPVKNYLIREVDTVKVRGRTAPTIIYEVYDADPEEIKLKKQKTHDLMFQAIIKYKCQLFEEALDLFRECLEQFAEDVVALMYLKRCRYFQKFPPADPLWDGVVLDTDSLIDHNVRRHWFRYEVDSPIHVYSDKAQLPLECRLRDISVGGIRVQSNQSFPNGTLLTIEGVLGGSHSESLSSGFPINMFCRVVWQAQKFNDEAIWWELGMETLIMPFEIEKMLEQTLDQLAQKKGPFDHFH